MRKSSLFFTAGIFMAGSVLAASMISFENKVYIQKYTKTFGNNSTLEVYLPQGETGNYSSGILKGIFSIEDAQSENFKSEMEKATTEITSEKAKTSDNIWKKTDILGDGTYIVATCNSLGNLMQKVACTYNKTTMINNNSSIKMFVYTKEYNLGSSSKVDVRLNSEYQKIKPALITEE